MEIVALQENELTRNENVVGNTRGNQGLLRKWREKVFALMVQLHCQKIVEENEKRQKKAKVGVIEKINSDKVTNIGLVYFFISNG